MRNPNAIRLLVLAIVLSACGASARDKTIRATFNATNVAADHLVTFSKEQEAKIVAEATSLPDGEAKLAAFRTKVDKAELALASVYRAIAVAALAKDDKSVVTLLQVAAILKDELTALGVKL